MPRPTLRAPALLALTLAVASCGGAAEEQPKAPTLSSQDLRSQDLSTPDGAYAAVARAEGEVALALGASAGGVPGELPAQPAAPEPPPPPPPPPPVAVAQASAAPVAPSPAPAAGRAARSAANADTPARAEERDAKPKTAPASGGGSCASACAALVSMERATDHLCGLAGAEDARCTDARARVKSATARVRATCPACAG